MKKLLACLLTLTLALGAMLLPASAEGNVYTALYGSEVSTLNYLTSGTTWDLTVGANTVDTLIEYNSIGEIVPGLAESWETSEDQLTWTFHLRQGQKWYDCTCAEVADVTANDFVAAAKYVLTPEYDSSVEYMFEEANILNAAAYYGGEITDFAEVGVKALDDYTLQYTLSQPTPYLLSCMTYGSFMPAYGPQLEELGAEFATSNDKMYYNGVFILTEFEPQVKHTYVKNVNNWDADNVKLDGISRIYNAEAATLAPTMALRGEVDYADLSNDIIDDWQANYPDIISRGRVIPDYSYFYCFNFDPQYDAEYGPDNWRIAVNNSNFRHSIMSAFDRTYVMRALEPDDPESLLQNTITPSTFCAVDGKDYSTLDAFADIDQYFFNADKALEYKAKAVEELTAAGATFPVTIVLTYKSGTTDWENECILFKQQLEGVLGTDYINVELYAGPSESFLSATRRAGVYSMMRCNWGADYADPLTWASPFSEKISSETGLHTGNSYNKMDMMLDSDCTETKTLLEAYYAAVEDAQEQHRQHQRPLQQVRRGGGHADRKRHGHPLQRGGRQLSGDEAEHLRGSVFSLRREQHPVQVSDAAREFHLRGGISGSLSGLADRHGQVSFPIRATFAIHTIARSVYSDIPRGRNLHRWRPPPSPILFFREDNKRGTIPWKKIPAFHPDAVYYSVHRVYSGAPDADRRLFPQH